MTNAPLFTCHSHATEHLQHPKRTPPFCQQLPPRPCGWQPQSASCDHSPAFAAMSYTRNPRLWYPSLSLQDVSEIPPEQGALLSVGFHSVTRPQPIQQVTH